jgi:hypothetical protein
MKSLLKHPFLKGFNWNTANKKPEISFREKSGFPMSYQL